MYEPLTQIQAFYARKNILITGGTGFIGKLVVEKLLRSCQKLNKIFLLVRPKKGKTPDERLNDLFCTEAFSNVHIYNEHFKSQVRLVDGDIEKVGLGLSDADRKMLIEEVDFIINMAACVRFDVSLQNMAYSNVRSTMEMIKLAKEMKHLKVFTHMSTAFSFCHRKEKDENIYDIPMQPQELVEMAEILSEEKLEQESEKLRGQWPNNYVFTKAMAEHIVKNEGIGITRVIVRPSIVVSALSEPHPGWVDTVFGPIGSTHFTSLGFIHTALFSPNDIVDYVPSDFCVNHTICAAYDIYNTSGHNATSENVSVYTLGTSYQNPMIGRHYNALLIKSHFAIPTSKGYNHCWTVITKNYLLFITMHYIFHLLPAYLLDFALYCLRKKPIAVKGCDKYYNAMMLTRPFITKTMIFRNDNTQGMLTRLTEKDKAIFYFDVTKLNWHRLAYFGTLGVRRYLSKERMFYIEDFNKADGKILMLKYIHYFIIISLISIFIKLII